MLVLHHDSSCDICLDSYSATKTPFAVACGHIFCSDCLTKCTPTICPICRGKYKLDRIKKLHVEAAPNATTQGNTTQTAFAEYLQMVAMVSGVEASEEDVNQVATRVEEWINTLPSQHLHIRPLRLVLQSIYAARETREQLKDERENRLAVERKFDRLEEDLRQNSLVEASLLAQCEETKRELDMLQLKYDHLQRENTSSPRSRSSSDSKSETRSNKSPEAKSSQKKRPVDGVYSITPGAAHAERVQPPPQKKTPNSAVPSTNGNDHKRKEKGKISDGSVPAPLSGLGLFTDSNNEPNGAGVIRVEDAARAMNRGSVEADLPNPGRNALGMDMGSQRPYGMATGSEDWGRSHHSANTSLDSSLANLAILSPPDASRTTHHRNHSMGSLPNGTNPATDLSPTPSTASWGTSNHSSSSLGDMSLNGLPPVASSSSLNLGITGLDDYHEGQDSDEDEDLDGVMTPGAGRHADLAHDRHRYESANAFTPRFSAAPELHNHRPAQIRHMTMPIGMTPRVINRSMSDVPTHTRHMDPESDEEDLELIGMRFSQSFSDIEPALSSAGATGSLQFDLPPPPSEKNHRRRASTSATLGLTTLDMDALDLEHGVESGSASAHPNFGRSVTFSTPKPQLQHAHTTRAQPTALPPTNNSRSHGFIPNLQSFIHTGHGKRPHSPKAVPATPYVNTTRVVASSTTTNGATHPMHRGSVTVSAPLRPLPETYDATYTSVATNNGRALPTVHYNTPYVAPRAFSHNSPANNGNGVHPPQTQSSYTLQPVSVQGPPEPSKQPRSTAPTQPPQAQPPILHAPQPVSGKSHIGKPWREWK